MTELTDFFARRKKDGAPLVLAIVLETHGSTYSKAGERLIIDRNGVYRGLLSGGCLEGDLAIRAQQVLETSAPAIVEYQLAEDDEIWGMGSGCDGSLKIFLQPLSDPYEPLASILETSVSDDAIAVALLVEGNSKKVGQFAIAGNAGQDPVSDESGLALQASAMRCLEAQRSGISHTDAGGEHCSIMNIYVEPPPRLLVLGAAPDSAPLLRIAHELGWRCTVYDHRPAYTANVAEPFESICDEAAALSKRIDLSLYDRCVVMSHHLASDREYLGQLAASDMNYIGLLGPAGRRDRLLEELGSDAADRLHYRLHGPAGLDIRSRGPAAIALSIVAEIQQLLH